MNSYIHRLKKTHQFLENLNIDHNNNALWSVLHNASWHYTLDWVMWIEHNPKLISKIIKHECVTEFSENLQQEIRESFLQIIRMRK